MTVTTKTTEKYSFATVSNSTSGIVVAYITADLHKGGDSLSEYLPWFVLTEALRGGCGNLSRDAFLDKLNMLGSSISVSAANRMVTIELRSTAETFDKTAALLKLMLTEPTFAPAELKRIKSTLKNELEDAREDSKIHAELGLRNALWGNNDRRHSPTIDQLTASINKVSKKDLDSSLKNFRQTFWQITFGGSDEQAKKFERVASSIQLQVAKATLQPQVALGKPARTVFHEITSRQNIDFAIGSILPLSVHGADFPALTMGIAILGKWGGFAGRLMSTVREKEGLTYSIYARTENFYRDEQGQWRIFTFFAPEKAIQGVTSTMREVTNIFKKGVTEEELTAFKRIVKTQELLSHDSLVGYTGKIHSYHVLGLSPNEIASLLNKQDELTVTDVNAAIKKYLNPKALTISAAGPIKTVKKDLVSLLETV